MKNRTPHSAMNTQIRFGHMLWGCRLFCQKFSTPSSLRHTAYIYCLPSDHQEFVGHSYNCVTLVVWWVILALENNLCDTNEQTLGEYLNASKNDKSSLDRSRWIYILTMCWLTITFNFSEWYSVSLSYLSQEKHLKFQPLILPHKCFKHNEKKLNCSVIKSTLTQSKKLQHKSRKTQLHVHPQDLKEQLNSNEFRDQVHKKTNYISRHTKLFPYFWHPKPNID